MVSEPEVADLDRLLASYGLRRSGKPSRIRAGTLNQNSRVPTDDGLVFARCYRPELDLSGIHGEHEVTRWVAARGIPAVAPQPAADGETVVELRGRRWSVYPWVDGRVPVRGAITAHEAESIGDVHGGIQEVLAEHPASDRATLQPDNNHLAWDPTTSAEVLSRIEKHAARVSAPSTVLEALAFQRQLLENTRQRPFPDFRRLPRQLVHGDYHDAQVLLGEDDAVAAVVDWEKAGVAARVWELIRSLSFSLMLETDLLEHYVRGYRRHVSLTEEECRGGIELWWQTRLHGTWVYEAYFLEGNDRVGAFLQETDEHLRRFADEDWRAEIADRLVAAAVQP